MALLDFPFTDPEQFTLVHGDVYLRYPTRDDYADWASVRGQSRDFLQPWEPAWTEDELSASAYKRRMKVYTREIRSGQLRPFFVFRESDDQFVGSCVLSNIRRGVSQTAAIGYWVGEAFARQGYTYSSLCAVLAHAFDALGIERVEAACMPKNKASRTLLTKVGFRKEGLARGYLRIDGRREDHISYAALQEDFETATYRGY